MYKDVLTIGEPVPVEELTAKKSGSGRQPTPTEMALRALVEEVAKPENMDKAYPWDFKPMKPITARATATRAIKATGKDGQVFVGSKNDRLWFSQKALTKRGRKKA